MGGHDSRSQLDAVDRKELKIQPDAASAATATRSPNEIATGPLNSLRRTQRARPPPRASRTLTTLRIRAKSNRLRERPRLGFKSRAICGCS